MLRLSNSTTPYEGKSPLAASELATGGSDSQGGSHNQTFVPMPSEKAALIAAQAQREAALTGHASLSPLSIGGSSSSQNAHSLPSMSPSPSPISPIHPQNHTAHSQTSVSPAGPASLPPSGTNTGIEDPQEDNAAFRRKWEILAELGPGEAGGATAGPSSSIRSPNSPSSPTGVSGADDWRRGMPRADGRARVEMDAGRLPDRPAGEAGADEVEEILPPNYDPAWRSN